MTTQNTGTLTIGEAARELRSHATRKLLHRRILGTKGAKCQLQRRKRPVAEIYYYPQQRPTPKASSSTKGGRSRMNSYSNWRASPCVLSIAAQTRVIQDQKLSRTTKVCSKASYKSLIGLSPLHRSVSLFLLRSLLAKRVDIDIDRMSRVFLSLLRPSPSPE